MGSVPTGPFLGLWIAAGLLPLVLLPPTARGIVALAGPAPLAPVLFLLFAFLFAGGQAFAVRPLVVRSGAWFVFSILGCIAAMVATFPILGVLDPLGLSEVAVLSLSHGVGGLVVGTAQWLILRKHVPGAWIWIPVHGVLWSTLVAGWYPLFDAAWAPGRMPVGFEGDHELRQLLRVTATGALATGPILLRLSNSRFSTPESQRDVPRGA